ncbi:hypothetical protein HDU81_008213 [Chytriomyces hyalinus]|nr:hypothetical protein HDU81_008213 [Chytriomyces hyalinus]
MKPMNRLAPAYQNQKRDSSLTLTEDASPLLSQRKKNVGTAEQSWIINMEYPDQLSAVASISPSCRRKVPMPSLQIPSEPPAIKPSLSGFLRTKKEKRVSKLKPLSSASYTNKIHAISNKFKLEGDECLFNKRDAAKAILHYTKAIDMCLSPCPKILARYDRVNCLFGCLNDPPADSRMDAPPQFIVQPCAPPQELFVLRARARIRTGDYKGAWDDCDVVLGRLFEHLAEGDAYGDSLQHDSLEDDMSALAQRAFVRRQLGDIRGALEDYQLLLLKLSTSAGNEYRKECAITEQDFNISRRKMTLETERGLRISTRLISKQLKDEEYRDLSHHVDRKQFSVFREHRINFFTLQDSCPTSDSEEWERIHLTHQLHSRLVNLLYHTLLPGIIQCRRDNAYDFDRREQDWTWESVGILDSKLSDTATSLSRLIRVPDSGTKPGIRSLFRVSGGYRAIYEVGIDPSNVHLFLPILAASVSVSCDKEELGCNTLEMSVGGRLQQLIEASFVGTCGFDVEHDMTEFIAPLALRILDACFSDEACLETVFRECDVDSKALKVWGLVLRRLVDMLGELANDFHSENGENAVYEDLPRAAPVAVVLVMQILSKIVCFPCTGAGIKFLSNVSVELKAVFTNMAAWLNLSPLLLDGERIVEPVCQSFQTLLGDVDDISDMSATLYQILDAFSQIRESQEENQEQLLALVNACTIQVEAYIRLMLRTPSATSTATAQSGRTRKPVNYTDVSASTAVSPSPVPAATNSPTPNTTTELANSQKQNLPPPSPVKKSAALPEPVAVKFSPPKRASSILAPDTCDKSISEKELKHSAPNNAFYASRSASARSSPVKSDRASANLNAAKAKHGGSMDSSWKELYEDLYEKSSIIEQGQEKIIKELRDRCEDLEIKVLSLQKELLDRKKATPEVDISCKEAPQADGSEDAVVEIQKITQKIKLSLGMKPSQITDYVVADAVPPKPSMAAETAPKCEPTFEKVEPEKAIPLNPVPLLAQPVDSIKTNEVLEFSPKSHVNYGLDLLDGALASPPPVKEASKISDTITTKPMEPVSPNTEVPSKSSAGLNNESGSFESDMLNIMNSFGF